MDARDERPRGTEHASGLFLEQVKSKGRTLLFAIEGSEELRYLNVMNAHANVGGPRLTHIILKEEARTIEVWEEFLHGTQMRYGIVDRLGLSGAEIHVKEFMIRHRRLLGLSEDDVAVLAALLGGRKHD